MPEDRTNPYAGLPPQVLHQVEHYRQQYNWDCGVSCVLMLLPNNQREETVANLAEICKEEGFNQSTWTIDLCYLLKRFGIEHRMYTITMGVNEDYKRHGYYNKIINLDRERVRERFELASSRGVVVRQGALELRQLLKHLSQGPVILLIDAGLLACDLCKRFKLRLEFRRCFGGSYRGHYILVVGYNSRSGRLLYRDPAVPDRLCAASNNTVLTAASASGTDRDAILVYKTKHNKNTDIMTS